ncbi:flavin reductase family protein [Pararhodobacter sp.]|uniref:flavin reductase family protein n=1 Tax=Pararhodobacter sp. TaxID=2127056 RepID=UPI002FDE8790
MDVRSAALLVDEYKNAMRHVATSVAVVTYRDDDGWKGQTTTAICSATTEPPTLVVCIRNDKPAAARIRAAGGFAVNYLTDEQAEIARRFSTSTGTEGSPFDTGAWAEGASGAPVLAGAVASFDCRLERAFEHGSHNLLLGHVLKLQMAPGENLLYRDGFFRRLLAE